jgi:hypothetical protein
MAADRPGARTKNLVPVGELTSTPTPALPRFRGRVAIHKLSGESEHPRADGLTILHDLVVVYPQDDNAEAPQSAVSLHVQVATVVVDRPVDLDSKLERRTVEVDDEASDGLLASKPQTSEGPTA